jgi:hypothetical protein
VGPVCQLDRSVFELVEVPDPDGVTWIRAVADLDRLSATAGYAQLLTIWRSGPPNGRLVVEFDSGCFIDVQGLRMLLEISRVVRSQGGTVVLVSSSRTVAGCWPSWIWTASCRSPDPLPTRRPVALRRLRAPSFDGFSEPTYV